MADFNKYTSQGAREIDNFWDGTLNTDLWTGTALSTTGSGGESVGALYCYGSHGSNGGDAYQITSKFDIRMYKFCNFYFSGFGYGLANNGSGSGSGSCALIITDGTNSSTILQFGAGVNTSSSGYTADAVGSGGYWVTLSYDGTYINVRLQGWYNYHTFLDTAYISFSNANSVVADNTNINVSTWSKVNIQIYAQGTGGSSAGNADGGSGTGQCTLAGLTVGSKKLGSKGTE